MRHHRVLATRRRRRFLCVENLHQRHMQEGRCRGVEATHYLKHGLHVPQLRREWSTDQEYSGRRFPGIPCAEAGRGHAEDIQVYHVPGGRRPPRAKM